MIVEINLTLGALLSYSQIQYKICRRRAQLAILSTGALQDGDKGNVCWDTSAAYMSVCYIKFYVNIRMSTCYIIMLT